MSADTFHIGNLEVRRGERGQTRLPVTTLLVGAELGIPLHVAHGTKDGPVLGLISGIHGAEHFAIRILRQILLEIDCQQLAGTVVAIPVANPVAFARSKYSTPEEDIDFGDMNRIFPGSRATACFGGGASQPSDRSLTEWMAATIAECFLSRVEILIDYHCGFFGFSIVESIARPGGSEKSTQTSFDMCRHANLGVIIQSGPQSPTSATGYAASLGAVAAGFELGGSGLSGAAQRKALEIGVAATRNTMRFLGMLPGTPKTPGRQLVGNVQPYIRPTKAGYLLTRYDPDGLFARSPLGIPVREGELLGTVFDAHTLEEVEHLVAPVNGILNFCRVSGPVEAGAYAYAVTAYEGARWIDGGSQ